MDYQTRFSITLSALKKGDNQSFLNNLEHHLTVHIHEMMISVNANPLLRKRKAEKDYFTPQHEFLHAWLIHYGEYSTAQADRCIDLLKAKERADFAARHPGLVAPTEHADNVISLDAYKKK